jgi:hypothetical protein
MTKQKSKSKKHTKVKNQPQQQSQPKTLPEFLEQIKDWRRGQGRMHRLSTVLLIILMAVMSGCSGQRPVGDFVARHNRELIDVLKPKNNKLPSYQTIARVMQKLDYDKFSSVFFSWAKTVISIEDKEWMSLDGKAIHGTTTNAGSSKQAFTNLVSLFSVKTKQVLTQGKVANKTNEIPLVAQLVKQLGVTGIVFTADALHCQKNTTKTIVKSGNDYVIGVKDNQKKLHNTLKKTPNLVTQPTPV